MVVAQHMPRDVRAADIRLPRQELDGLLAALRRTAIGRAELRHNLRQNNLQPCMTDIYLHCLCAHYLRQKLLEPVMHLHHSRVTAYASFMCLGEYEGVSASAQYAWLDCSNKAPGILLYGVLALRSGGADLQRGEFLSVAADECAQQAEAAPQHPCDFIR